jgi:trehalose 6-phosphate phosphatase
VKYLWRDLHLIKSKVTRSEKTLVLLDYDGTLAPIVERPKEAIFPSRAKTALESLLRIPRYRVSIISGRAVEDVAAMVGLEDMIYAGNHGLEILYPGGHWVHPEAARLRPKLAEVVQGLAQELGHIPGLLIEDKGVTVSVHYRLVVADLQEEIMPRVRKVLHPFAPYFKLTEGKKVLEVRPKISFHKGTVIYSITHLLNAKEADVIIYIGDDETDEDAFAALKPEDIGIKVGESTFSQASYFVRDTEELHDLLEVLGLWSS